MPDARLARTAATLAAIAAAYCAASWLGVWLSRDAGNVAAFWPADGLLLGILLRHRGRWAATLGACAGAKLAVKLLLGSGLIVSAGFIASNMLQVAIALALLARLTGLPLRLTSLRELAAFALAAGIVGPAIGASTAALMLHGALGAPFWLMWRTWWIAGAVGMLLVAPAIAAYDGCLELRRFLAGRRGHLAAAELATVVSLLLGGLWLVAIGNNYGCPSLFAPILLWAALRFGIGPTAAAGLAVGLGATVAAALGAWPLPYATDAAVADRLGPLQLFLVVTALPPLVVAVVTAERARAQAALAESERRYAFALEAARDAFWDWHIPSGESRASPRWEAMLGYAPGELPQGAEDWARTVHPDDVGAVIDAVERHLQGVTDLFEAEYRSRHKDGHWLWLASRGRIMERDAAGRPVRMLGTTTDVTERKRLELELERRATRDPLTGLANRALFAADLKRALARAARDGGRLAVMLVDLDRFKEVNDTHGHAAGDALLVEVARRLEGAVREGDLVARLGGDEFAVLATGTAQDRGFAVLADRIVARLAEPLPLGDRELAPGASLGLAVHPDEPGGPEELLAAADRALYAVKAAGRGGWAGGPARPAAVATAPAARPKLAALA